MVQVKEIMTDPVTIDKSERIAHALDIMEKNGIRRMLVTNDGKLGGTITMRQITRVLGTRKSLGMSASSLHVAAATQDAIIKILPDMDLDDAIILLQKTAVLVPVEGDEILGWVRPRDVLGAVTMEGVASEAMRVPLSIHPQDRLVHARRMMLDRDVGRLPVVEAGRLVGMLSERDVAKALKAFRELNETSSRQYSRIDNLLVQDVMTRDVQTARADTPLEDIRKILLNKNRGGMPVLNQRDELVGMITRTTLVDYLAQSR